MCLFGVVPDGFDKSDLSVNNLPHLVSASCSLYSQWSKCYALGIVIVCSTPVYHSHFGGGVYYKMGRYFDIKNQT